MSWFGKIMGGGVGMMLGGPIGAIIGATLGHALIDDKVRVQYAEQGKMTGHEQRQMVFFTAVFAMLGKMAKADGKVSPAEVKVVEDFINNQLGLDTTHRQFAIGIFNEAKSSSNSFASYASQFGKVFESEPQLRTMFYEMLFKLAMADGVLHPAEDQLLREAPAYLGLHVGIYETVKREFGTDLAHYYAILGLNDNATQSEVKKAYRKLVSEYHPDKVIAKGLPEDFVKYAEGKFREINEAYEAIMKA